MESILCNPGDSRLWSQNSILWGRAKSYETPTVTGTLSLKTVLHGEATWTANRRAFKLDRTRYLLLNEGTGYRLDINSKTPVETFCIFFRPGFMNELLASRSDILGEGAPTTFEFAERLALPDEQLSNHLAGLRALLQNPQSQELVMVDSFLLIAERIVDVAGEAKAQHQALPTAREATRTEIFKRLNIARDYIISNLDKNLDLQSMADPAALSPFHFHRLFREAYGQTPGQFLTDCRMHRARSLLASTDEPVSNICQAVGFQSLPTFCNQFRKRFGQNASALRGSSFSQG
ncbi:MAG: helix-turn-helix transcriptional regulator [Armatimonadetes bacterium]|nr:helix-turn-helix transcriptional regulator [Armatimonadota bacterium]